MSFVSSSVKIPVPTEKVKMKEEKTGRRRKVPSGVKGTENVDVDHKVRRDKTGRRRHSQQEILNAIYNAKMDVKRSSKQCRVKTKFRNETTEKRLERFRSLEKLADRPPSRQRDAFPKHLIDTNAFDVPETNERRGGSSGSSTSSHTRRYKLTDSSCSPDILFTDRPPSRSIKSKWSHHQGRTAMDKRVLFSYNQEHHDPRTDGFADVDESVPPPFRIKVTTESCATTQHRVADAHSTPLTARYAVKPSRKEQHWPYGNQKAHLVSTQLQWFGKDDQINNAHSFETVIFLPSPRPSSESTADIASENDLEDSRDYTQTHERFAGEKQEPQGDLDSLYQTEIRFPSRRAAVASQIASPMTPSSESNYSEFQWIRSSTNPLTVNSFFSRFGDDSMDLETAIEQASLYSSTMEMTDLHLDDYTALGDVAMPVPTPKASGMEWTRRSNRTPAFCSPPLGSSLSKDFLSLFAQH